MGSLRELRLEVDVEEGHMFLALLEGDRVLHMAEGEIADGIPPCVSQVITDLARRNPIRLSIVAASSALNLPWEEIVADRSVRIRIVRGHGKAGTISERRPRVLVAWCDPQTTEYGPLASVEAEARRILEALANSDCKKHHVFELPNATARSLERKIRTWRPHIVHFIGHADIGVIGGYLVVEAGIGKAEFVYGEDFGRWLGESGVELAIVSGCRSAGLDGSVAQAVSAAGIASVIGMRERVPDWSAMAFSRAFYASLALGETIEAAFEEGRSAMPEWSLPVLLSESTQTTASHDRHNIPYDPRPFIGRIREREAVLTYLTRPNDPVRTLALHAMGGMGKTRLAQQVGRDAVRHFSAGVWFVDCESMTDPDQLWGAIGTAIGVEGGKAAVIDAIGGLRCLLILDCLERLAETPGLIDLLQRDLPNVQFLITTRVLPEGATPMVLDPMADTAGERMALFEVAVRQFLPDFKVTSNNRKHCKDILSMLQGVPLAIFLAAGRLRHLSLEDLRDRLKESRLGVVGPRGKVGRHASLRIVVEDSFSLLSETSRELAMRLAIFAGGFRLSDARSVFPDVSDIEDGIFTLCDHSMLSPQGIAAGTRYRSLDTVREFLDEASANLDLALDRKRFFGWALERAESMHAFIRAGKLPEAFDILRLEVGNFRSALTIGNDLNRFRYLLLRPFLEAGYVSEFLELAANVDIENDKTLAEIRGLEAIAARRQGHLEDELNLWQEKIQACRRCGDIENAVETAIDLASALSRRGDWDRCMTFLQESEGELKGCPPTLKVSHGSLKCLALQHFKRFTEATALANETEKLILKLPHPNLYALINMSEYHRRASDFELAKSYAVDGVTFALRVVNNHGLGKAAYHLALALAQLADHNRSQQAFNIAYLAAAFVSSAMRKEIEQSAPSEFIRPRVPRKDLEGHIARLTKDLLSSLES